MSTPFEKLLQENIADNSLVIETTTENVRTLGDTVEGSNADILLECAMEYRHLVESHLNGQRNHPNDVESIAKSKNTLDKNKMNLIGNFEKEIVKINRKIEVLQKNKADGSALKKLMAQRTEFFKICAETTELERQIK